MRLLPHTGRGAQVRTGGFSGSSDVADDSTMLSAGSGVPVGLALALLHAHLHPIAVDMHRLDGRALQQTYSRRVQQHDDGLVSDLPQRSNHAVDLLTR